MNHRSRPSRAAAPQAPADLIDFFLRWPEFRPMAERLAGKKGLSRQDRMVTEWLIALADSVSRRDVQ